MYSKLGQKKIAVELLDRFCQKERSMRFGKNTVGAVVFPCGIGGLGIVRSLGQCGIPIIAVDSSRWAYGLLSRYCYRRVVLPNVSFSDELVVKSLVKIGSELPNKFILYPTSDESLLLVSRYRSELLPYFRFIFPEHNLLENLVSKQGMYQVALQYDMPTPKTLFPQNEKDVISFSESVMYPCLFKTVYSHSPLKKIGKTMVKVSSPEQLLTNYRLMAPVDAKIMIQEYIPGEDSQMFLYDAYFNAMSDPKLVFTGRKLRQTPINFGAGSLCECRSFPKLEPLVTTFCKAINYKGLIDIGLKWDARDETFKVLDINPRIGQNFRTFITSKEKLDLALAAYLDLTDKSITDCTPLDGRRWLIEDDDLISSIKYYRAKRLSIREWITSFRGVQECAFFSVRDPLPWIVRYITFIFTPLWERVKKIVSALFICSLSLPRRIKS